MANQNSSKTNFFLGLSTGVAVVALVGFLIMAGLYFNQNKDLALVDTTAPENNEVKENDNSGGDSTVDGTQPEVSGDSNITGNLDAKVTVVEYSDFQCPFCSRFHPTVKQALDAYSDKIRVVYKHFPLDSIHPQARPAAEASECAAEQDNFWAFHDALFENQSQLSTDFYKQVAVDLSLNSGQFNECLSSRKYKDKVEADYREGISLGVRGTPASFVNGKMVSGAVPYATLDAAIQDALSNL